MTRISVLYAVLSVPIIAMEDKLRSYLHSYPFMYLEILGCLQSWLTVRVWPYCYLLSTPLSGNFNNSSANNQGSNGNFWSSTYNNGNNMYNLNVNSSNVNPTNNNNRNNGNSVRFQNLSPILAYPLIHS